MHSCHSRVCYESSTSQIPHSSPFVAPCSMQPADAESHVALITGHEHEVLPLSGACLPTHSFQSRLFRDIMGEELVSSSPPPSTTPTSSTDASSPPLSPSSCSPKSHYSSVAPPPYGTYPLVMNDSCADEYSIPLSTWDQAASRLHVRITLSFPLANENRETVASHLQGALASLAAQRPDFAGRLHLGPRPGWVCLRQSPHFEIPFEAEVVADCFGCTYAQLKTRGFPAVAFLHPRYALGCRFDGDVSADYARVPATFVRALFIDGGLILGVFFHHAFGDGECLRSFLECFAAQTRGESSMLAENRLLDFIDDDDEPASKTQPNDFERLLEQCPEFSILPDLSGPNQPTLWPGGDSIEAYDKTGKIFLFTDESLKGLKDLVVRYASETTSPRPPSSYTCLAAITWAHVARARRMLEPGPPGVCTSDVASLLNPVNWLQRAFHETNKCYFGNATALALTRVPVSRLMSACDNDADLAWLVREIETAICSIDEGFVRKRVALFEAAPDPRAIGLTYDPRVPHDLTFNTWRFFGADTEWDLCGNGAVKPDSLRRPQDEWNMGGCLILPARADSSLHEMILTIPRPSMQTLCQDKRFMKWTSGVID